MFSNKCKTVIMMMILKKLQGYFLKPNVLRQGGSQPFIFLEVKCMRFGTSGQSSEGGLS